MSFFSRLKTAALDLVFPAECLACGSVAPNAPWCERCSARIPLLPYLYCPGCNKRAPAGRSCEACREKTGLAGLVAAYPYSAAVIREAVLQFKYHGITIFAETFSRAIVERINAHTPPLALFSHPETIVVPVPLARERFKERGFNQAELIATKIATFYNVPLLPYALRRVRETEPQAGLEDAGKRRENVAGAFALGAPELVRAKTVVLVDDVYTTGATMCECAKALRRARAKEVWGVAIARG